MKKLTLLTLGVITGMSLFSCKKSSNSNVSTPTATSTTADSIFNMLRVSPKLITVNAVTGGSYYGNSGTRYIFSPNSFQTANGAAVTGSVQVMACEYLKKGDMLFSKMLPVSDDAPLLSGGEISVSASQNGQPVYLKPFSIFQANIPNTGALPQGLQFFAARQNKDTSKMLVNWVVPKVDSANYHINVVAAGAGVHDSLAIISDSLYACNADAFMAAPNYQTFTVTASVSGITMNSDLILYGYTLYDTYKGVWPLGRIGSYSNGIFTEHHVPNIPVHFVIFGIINGKFYGGVTAATPANDAKYTVTLAPVDAATFKEQLNNL